jgi:hypothetical protein
VFTLIGIAMIVDLAPVQGGARPFEPAATHRSTLWSGDLIAYRKQYSLVPLNRFVDLDALIAHSSPSLNQGGRPPVYVMATTLICFNDNLEHFEVRNPTFRQN